MGNNNRNVIKTQGTTLEFKIGSISELNDSNLYAVVGGSNETKITFYFITIANQEPVLLVLYNVIKG